MKSGNPPIGCSRQDNRLDKLATQPATAAIAVLGPRIIQPALSTTGTSAGLPSTQACLPTLTLCGTATGNSVREAHG